MQELTEEVSDVFVLGGLFRSWRTVVFLAAVLDSLCCELADVTVRVAVV